MQLVYHRYKTSILFQEPPNTLQINVTEVYLGASKFDVFVTWEPPAAIPEYYNFTLVGAIIKDRHENVSLTAPSVIFHKEVYIKIFIKMFEIASELCLQFL